MSQWNEEKFRFSADLLVIRRRLLNYSQRKLGKLAGVSCMTISKWERGLSEPSKENVGALARIFKVSPKRMLLIDLDDRERVINAKR